MTRKTKGDGPQFVRYFGPLLDALRALGGSGSPDEVVEGIATVSGFFIGMPTTMASTGPHRAPGRLVCENSA